MSLDGKMGRRGFIGLMAGAAVAGLGFWSTRLFRFPPVEPGPARELELNGFVGITDRVRDLSNPNKYSFTDDMKPRKGFLALSDRKNMITAEIPFYGHTIDFDSQGRWAYSFQKWGRHGVIADRATGRPVHFLHSGKDRRFFGHALMDDKRGRVIVSEHNDKTGHGELSVRELETGKVIRYVRSGGIYPHDMRMLAGDRFVVINAFVKEVGDTSRLCEFDLDTMKMARSLDIPFEKGTALHMNVLPDGRVAIGGRAYNAEVKGHLGFAVIVQPDNSLLPLEIPAHVPKEYFLDEFINLTSSPAGDLVATTLISDYVHRWSFEDGKYKDFLKVPDSMGLLYLPGKDAYMVTSAKNKEFFLCNFREKSVVQVEGFSGGNGSHIGFLQA